LDHVEAVRLLELPATTHPLVRRAYDRARRLLLWSWIEREFIEVAELEAIRSLEFYLGEKTRPEGRRGSKPWKAATLGALLKTAEDRGWVRDTEDLRASRFAQLGGLDHLEAIGSDWEGDQVFPELIKWLSDYRNTLAHGSQIHGPWGGYAMLRVIRELLCQASEQAAEPPSEGDDEDDTPRM
jgi:hypothetical protein